MIEHTKFGNDDVILTFIPPEKCIKLDEKLITSVHCFPISGDNILFTVNPRGVDIIGGHKENGEKILETLKREAKEEACITLYEYQLIGAIQIDNSKNPSAIQKGYPMIGYQFFYFSTNFVEHPFEITSECTSRLWINQFDIPKFHHKWLNIHQYMIDIIPKYILKNDKIK